MQTNTPTGSFERIRQELGILGYTGDLIREDYLFADVLAPEYSVTSIPLAAFAQDPPSYRNACFGVVIANGQSGPALIERYRSLGAPQIFEVHGSDVLRWKMTDQGTPDMLEKVAADDVSALFNRNRSDWSPERILRAKSDSRSGGRQLDFFDLGLLPLLDREARVKLHQLLGETVSLAIQEFSKERPFEDDHYPGLFRLLFRLLAAKILNDRGYPGNWGGEHPQVPIESVQDLYFNDFLPEPVLEHPATQLVAWNQIRTGFHFQNLSVNTLAHVYENTLVAPNTRKSFAIHSTPPEVAEYIVSRLPIQDLEIDDRRVFEPFSGHAVFLVACMQKMREMLPPHMTTQDRHRYFVRMISGIEIDPFAREVARLSLMLADYPNPNGWRIYEGNAFDSPIFEREIKDANVVLCNPPFEDFNDEERLLYEDRSSPRKPAAIMSRILRNPPELLGFVLPHSFLSGRSYKELRTKLGETYGSLEIVSLPDGAFLHSDAEAILLTASKSHRRIGTLRASEVNSGDLKQFYSTHAPSRSSTRDFDTLSPGFEDSIWIPSLEDIWESTSQMDRLRDVAEVHRGIEYNIPLRINQAKLVSHTAQPGFVPGVHKVKGASEPFVLLHHDYLNVSSHLMRGRAYSRSWGQPKLILNARRLSRGAWTIAAAIDNSGLVCYQNFHGVWLRGPISLEALAAILNGPIANAFVATHEGKRDVRAKTLLEIPIPRLAPEQDESIASMVRRYCQTRHQWLAGDRPGVDCDAECSKLLRLIDGEVLRAYNLSPRLERSALDYFSGHPRPGPITFTEYFPSSFEPYLPWHLYLEVENSSATATLNRLPVMNDPSITEAMEPIYWDLTK